MSELKTFVFTDIVRSVSLKGQMAGRSDAERDEAFVTTILSPHRQRIEANLVQHGGRVVSTAGDGHFLVFANTIDAATWAVDVQEHHAAEPIKTPQGLAVEVRMSLHVGFPQADPSDPDNFIGRVVDYAARLNDYATGAQVLVSSAALGLLKDAGIQGVRFHRQGERDLRGIGMVEVHELLYDSHGPRPTRDKPKEVDRREWSVLPATMGLTEYGLLGGSSGAATKLSPPSGALTKRRLGNYELDVLLGAGGMGDVYKAHHVQFDRVRAVKVIKPQFLASGSQSIIKRFYREIKAVGALDHPNIVVAVDSSAPTDDTHYLVMEYVSGVAADELVKLDGPLAAADACEIVRQAAVGLDYIASQGMVHRDIKPSNLMVALARPTHLTGAGQATAGEPIVKILDLGLALLVDHDQPRLTQMDHGAMGTAMYMSPEQWRTTSVDIRADIYSLGCSLYHLLTGNPPFLDSDLKPEKAHERLAPPSVRGQSGVPRALDAALKKMMAKRPEDRYQSPAEVAQALQPLCEGADIKALVDRHSPESKTRPQANDETLAGSTRQQATQPLEPRRHYPTPYTQGPGPKRIWALRIGLLAALVVAGLLYWQVNSLIAKGRIEQERSKQKHLTNLTNLAAFAEPQLQSDIANRFKSLETAAGDQRLIDAMKALEENPEDWSELQAWIQGLSANSEHTASSWFITDQTGLQVARAPKSDSIGDSYWHRTYFHGGEVDLPEDTAERPEPVQGSHLSAVYRSDSSGRLKVAFSTPITNGAQRPKDRKVIGVLGMSIELGHFRLTKVSERLSPPLELVIVDLRKGSIEGGPLTGLLLHHPELDRYKRAFRLPKQALEQIQSSLTNDRQAQGQLIKNYPDVLNRNKQEYWGGYYPVEVPSRSQRDARWVVIVQEPMP